MKSGEFNSGDPLAYFITWTTYGTWLPGDERGWRHHGRGGVQEPDPTVKRLAQERMSEPAFTLTSAHRQIAEATVTKHCQIRNWFLHAVNARTNHVHAVVTAPNYDPKTVREQFQAWCTRKLKEVVIGRGNFWTERGSGRFINTEAELERVIQYVSEAQDLKHLDELWRSLAIGSMSIAKTQAQKRADLAARERT